MIEFTGYFAADAMKAIIDFGSSVVLTFTELMNNGK